MLTSLVMGYPTKVVFYISIASISTIAFSYNRLFFGFFRAFGTVRYEAVITALERVITALFGIALILLGLGLLEFFIAASAISVISAVVGFILLKSRYVFVPEYAWEVSFIKRLLKDAGPLLMLGIFSVIYFQIDILILSLFRSEDRVGLYLSSIRLMSLFQFIPGAIIAVLLPLMARQLRDKDKQLISSLAVSIRYMLVFGLFSAVLIFLFADKIILILYSEKFSAAAPALKILIWALPFFLVNPILGTFLIAAKRQKLPAISVAVTALANLILNLMVIPKYGFMGAAATTLISEFILLILQGYYSIKTLASTEIYYKKSPISIFCRCLIMKEVL